MKINCKHLFIMHIYFLSTLCNLLTIYSFSFLSTLFYPSNLESAWSVVMWWRYVHRWFQWHNNRQEHATLLHTTMWHRPPVGQRQRGSDLSCEILSFLNACLKTETFSSTTSFNKGQVPAKRKWVNGILASTGYGPHTGISEKKPCSHLFKSKINAVISSMYSSDLW